MLVAVGPVIFAATGTGSLLLIVLVRRSSPRPLRREVAIRQ